KADLMSIAKGLSSGYLPIGGVLVSDRVATGLIDKGGEFNHGFTYSGHPVAAAAAIANLNILLDEGIVDRVEKVTGPYAAEKWQPLAEHPLVGEARIIGLIGAIELVKDKGSRQFFADRGDVGTICRDICIENGLIMRAVEDTMVMSPPLCISEGEIDGLVELLTRCLDLTAEKVL
nr:aminotransferase class III-fold pyridoxal phosphate-dependent enzyme [Pseudomonadales bacterium]